MKSHLAKVWLALLSAVFVLGCQDLGTGVEASDGLGPQFTHKDPNKEHGKPGGGGGGGNTEAFELDLVGGMTTTGFDVNGTGSIFALQSNNFSAGIDLDFPLYEIGECEIIRGTDGVHHAPTIEREYEERLLDELDLTEVTTERNGRFGMDIDLTGLVPPSPTGPPVVVTSTSHFLDVNYDNEFGKRTLVALRGGNGATVRWSRDGPVDVFELAGPVMVALRGVTGEKGKKSNRTIRCGGVGDNVVTARVTRLAA